MSGGPDNCGSALTRCKRMQAREPGRHWDTSMDTTMDTSTSGPTLRPAAVDSSWLEHEWRVQLAALATAKATAKEVAAGAVLPTVEADRPPGGPAGGLTSQPQSQRPSAAETVVLKVVAPRGSEREARPGRGSVSTSHSGASNAAVHLLFGPHSGRGGTDASTVWSRIKAVLLDYTHTAHLHGVAYIGNPSCSVSERTLWAVATLLSALWLSIVTCIAIKDFQITPTVTVIEENNLPTHSIAFPAVTVCPTTRIRTSIAKRAVDHYLSNGFFNNQANISQAPGVLTSNYSQYIEVLAGVIHTLSNYHYPKYGLMNQGLRLVGTKLNILDGFVISQAMMQRITENECLRDSGWASPQHIHALQGRMTCVEIMAHCYWRGVAFSCCDQFQLQRTEMGYCMSFNSRTSTGPKILCPEKNCHHVSSTGPGTGLELVFKRQPKKYKPYDAKFHDKFLSELQQRRDTHPRHRPSGPDVWGSEDFFRAVNSWSFINNVYIMVHDREELPDVTSAFAFPTTNRIYYSMAIAYSGTVATDDLRSVSAKHRECLFNGELEVQMARQYTQSECIMECRVLYIAKSCACVPYFIEAYRGSFYNGIPECRFSQLPCLAALNLQAINCSRCIPACNINHYEVRDYPSINYMVQDAYLGSTLEISYDMLRTAVRHRQKLTSTNIDKIVAFGGMASLCLGCSILTGLDILHMLLRVGRAVFGYKMKPMYFTSSSRGERNEKQRNDVITSISQIIT